MMQSIYIKYVRKYVESVFIIDLQTGKSNNTICFIIFLGYLFLMVSTIININTEPILNEKMVKLYDVFLVVLEAANFMFALYRWKELHILVDFLQKPLSKQGNNVHLLKIVNRFEFWVRFFGNVHLICFLGVLVILVRIIFAFENLLIHFSEDRSEEFLCMPWGWLPQFVKSASVFYICYIISSITLLHMMSVYIAWNVVLILSLLKVNAELQFLEDDLKNLDDYVNAGKSLLLSTTIGQKRKSTEMASNLSSSTNTLQLPGSSTYEDFYNHGKLQGLNTLRKDSDLDIPAQVVDQHGKLIEYVRVLDNCYRDALTCQFQVQILVIALNLTQMTTIQELSMEQTIKCAADLSSALVVLGVYHYLGQMIINKSEELRFALYNLHWPDMSRTCKKSLLLMVTLTCKPLRLRPTGMPILGMEGFTKAVYAIYSYANLLLTLKFEQK